jgi:OOP family OmpA-OmpF porin
MKLTLLAGAALAAVCTASGAAAQVGWYGAVDLGYHWPESLAASSSNNAANGRAYEWGFNQKKDWAGFARLGYQVTDNWRVELEGGYRPGDMKSIRGDGTTQSIVGLCDPTVTRTAAAPNCGSPSGSMKTWTLMGNVIFDLAPHSAINPFIGVGAGFNHTKVNTNGQFSNVTGAITPTNPAIQTLAINDSDTRFAYQGIAGLAWRATDRLNVDFTYRYLAGSKLRLVSVGSNSLQPGTFRGQYKDQSVTVGLRYSFAPPPAPPPPPPPGPPPPPPPPPPPRRLRLRRRRRLRRPMRPSSSSSTSRSISTS